MEKKLRYIPCVVKIVSGSFNTFKSSEVKTGSSIYSKPICSSFYIYYIITPFTFLNGLFSAKNEFIFFSVQTIQSSKPVDILQLTCWQILSEERKIDFTGLYQFLQSLWKSKVTNKHFESWG